MSALMACWRGLGVLLHILTAAILVVFALALPQTLGLDPGWRPSLSRWWYRRLCHILGLRLHVEGRPAPATLLVANHVSWLDIPVLGAQGDLCFLSKAEIRAWPLIGWIAEVLGTLFIHRGAHQAGEMAKLITVRAREGRTVVIFPEATTSDGRGLLPFHPRLFAAAQASGTPLQPVALRYGEADRPDPIAPFIGNDQALAHLWRVLRHPGIQVRAVFLAPFLSQGLERKALAQRCRQAIGTVLGLEADAQVSAAGFGRFRTGIG